MRHTSALAAPVCRVYPALSPMTPLPAASSGSPARQAVWSRYWARGAEHSCAGSYDGSYGGEIARFWHARLSSMPAGSRVLDIATGNGALPRLLLDACADASITCDAVDLADVRPAWVNELPPAQRTRLRLHGGCAAEALPFGNESFNLVISQFGLEYSDLDRSLHEVRRMLAPGGQVALVLHHHQGRPVQLATVEVAHIEWLLAPEGLLDVARALLPHMALTGSAEGRAALARDTQANALRAAFNALQMELDTRADRTRGNGADIVVEARQASANLFSLAASQGATAAQQAWLGVHEWMSDALLRLRELQAHALDVERLHVVARRLAAPGTALHIGTLSERQHLMGWTLHGRGGSA